MATDTNAAMEELFKDEAPAPATEATVANGAAPKAPTDLAARVAAKRAKGKGAPGSASASAPTAPPSESTGPQSAPLAATDGISPNAKDELAKLAARREASGESPTAKRGKAGESPASTPSETGSGDGIPDTIPGLTSTTDGSTAYDKVQADLAAARARSTKPKGKPLTEKQKAAAQAKKEKEAAAKAKAKEKEKADREKAKAKEKTQKQKDAEAKKKTDAEAKKKARAEAETKRKAEIEAKKAKRRAELEAAKTPDLIGRENKATQAAFAEDYKLAGPKTERNPDGQGVRRAKSDRGDFAAGWMMCLRRMRKQAKGGAAAPVA